jgi:hypothetical protein
VGGGVARWLAGGVGCIGWRVATGSGGRRVEKRPTRGGGWIAVWAGEAWVKRLTRGGGWIAVWAGEAGVKRLIAGVSGAGIGRGGETHSLGGGCDAHRHAADAAGQPREETRPTAKRDAAEESEGSGRPRIGASAVCTALP